jgi:hypothetical protein
MGGVHRVDEVFLFDSLCPGAEHDCRAVRIIGADVHAVITPQFLETHPNVGLDILNEMTDVYMTVCVRQSGGNEYFTSQGTENENECNLDLSVIFFG